MLKLFAVTPILILCACTTPGQVRVEMVPVAVPISCIPKLGQKPDFPDSDAAIMAADNIIDLAKLYRAGRALRQAWIAEQAAALKACTG